MRVLQAKTKRPLDLLAIGSGGHVAAASSAFGVRGDVDLWEVASGRQVFTRNIDEREVESLSFTPDGQSVLASGGTSILFLDVEGRLDPIEVKPHLYSPETALSADGTRLIATERMNDQTEMECWAVMSDLTVRRVWNEGPKGFSWFYNPAITHSGNLVAVVTNVAFDRYSIGNPIEIRNGETGKVVTEIKLPADEPPTQLLFSVDGSKLLALPSGRTVRIFHAATGQPAGELVHPGRPYVTGMAVHPNGTVACSRNNGTVCFWNPDKCEPVRTLDWKLGKLVSVAFSPDGSIGAAGTEDGQVIVWDVDA